MGLIPLLGFMIYYGDKDKPMKCTVCTECPLETLECRGAEEESSGTSVF